MNWKNEPAAWEKDGAAFAITADHATDAWREPKEGGIRNNPHFYGKPVSGDFSAVVTFSGNYSAQFDQAGLMVHIDELNWMKCGIEYVDGIQKASAVVTRGWSDWSVVPLPNPPEVTFKVERKGAMVFVYYSFEEGSFIMLRKAYLTDADTLEVGIMAASPTGEGFTAVLKDFTVIQ